MIATIVIGFVIGLVARFLRPGRDPMGFILTTLLGIGGAVLASFAGRQIGMYQPGEPAGFIFSVVGALVILAIYHVMAKKNDLP